jgi:two-component system, chemotaxis family, chemotaxis protein CheY
VSSTAERQQQALLRRLQGMGLEARLMQGERCVLARMRLSETPFETLEGPVLIRSVVFATVGPDRIKCLRPRPLFQLPMLRVLDCADARALERRIRDAWRAHHTTLRRCRDWLAAIGAGPEPAEEGSVVTFPIAGEAGDVRAAMIDPRHVILPGRGPLSGFALSRTEDRLLRVPPGTDSSTDLCIHVTNRLEELERLSRRLQEERRLRAASHSPGAGARSTRVDDGKRSHVILLVGPRLVGERACIESLRLRGYDVRLARGESEALRWLDRSSPELVIAEGKLGRADGLELTPAVRAATGIEELPVVLVDDHPRPARRDAARRAGALGYLVHPIDVARIADRLAALVCEPRRRRYTRYARRLAVRMNGGEGGRGARVTTALGRGGMFLTSDGEHPIGSLERCELILPELGESLRIDAEILYRQAGGAARPGVGMRFRSFPDENEELLIRYLKGIERGIERGTGHAPA